MKSILISIRPKYTAKILNGDKTAEIRRGAPKNWKDYLSGKTKAKPEPMTGYIYCTKTIKPISDYDWGEFTFDDLPKLGKVVARFTLKEVEELYSVGNKHNGSLVFETKSYGVVRLYKHSCLDVATLSDYLESGKGPVWGYAWHISDLVVFDEPMELSEFEYLNPSGVVTVSQRSLRGLPKRPPQSWCYVEVRE